MRVRRFVSKDRLNNTTHQGGKTTWAVVDGPKDHVLVAGFSTKKEALAEMRVLSGRALFDEVTS